MIYWFLGSWLVIIVIVSVVVSSLHEPRKEDYAKVKDTPPLGDVSLVYSYTWHTAPDVFVDTMRNLLYYSRNYSVAVIVHCSPKMVDPLQRLISSHEGLTDRVRLHPVPTQKRPFTVDLYAAHIENAKWCKSQGLNPKRFVLMASNCYFHQSLRDRHMERGPAIKASSDRTTWHWPKFYRQNELLDILKTAGLSEFVAVQHEGLALPWDTMCKIVEFEQLHQLSRFSKKIKGIPFEEIFFGSLTLFFQEKIVSICKVFWNAPGLTPTVKQVQSTIKYPCIKRVGMCMHDAVRTWQRVVTSNYDTNSNH